jgi:ribosomal RNA-processing protein 17
MRGEDPNSDSGEEVFEGFDAPVNPAEELPDDAEYVDEDKYTTVTVEAMDNSADDEEPADVVGVPGKAADAATRKDEVEKKKRPWAKGKDGEDKKRVKKKKFRYESKAERSLTRQKQKSKSSAAAKARRKT